MQLQALVVLLTSAAAFGQTLTTYAEINCSGASQTFVCDGRCSTFASKRAFKVVRLILSGVGVACACNNSTTAKCVSIYNDAACTEPYFPNPNQTSGQCGNVEAGDPTLGITCDDVCVA
ncbi:hypothetical protein FB451DRAFT_1375740 [Mycena latifolia]|nr:hypothetical protein FB451DRAFT_1375740 [Mycena latifolia]